MKKAIGSIFILVTIMVGSGLFDYAKADGPARDKFNYFDLPGQALQLSLIEFALQANITIIADSSVIRGYTSSPVIGSYPTDKALSGLLANAPLHFRYLQETNSYVIERKHEAEEMPVAQKPTAKPVPVPIEEVVVTSVSYPFRYNTVTNTQLLGSIAYFDSSRFLNVIPRTLIEDQRPSDMGDVLKYASGVTPGDGIADSNDDIFIRGFQRHAIYLDGFRLSDTTGVKLLPANIEQIEVLKGPATLRYGQAEPGGIVNAVRKRPTSDSFLHAEAGLGNLGQRNVCLDINSQLPFTEDVDFRIILADEAKDQSADVSDIHKQLMALSASWQMSQNNTVDIGYEYQRAEQTWYRGFQILSAYEDVFDGASLDSFSKQARPEFGVDFSLFNVGLTHYFESDWRFNAKYVYHEEQRLGVRTTGDTLLKTNIFYDPDELGADYLMLVPGGQLSIPFIFFPVGDELYYTVGNIRSLYDEEAFDYGYNVNAELEGTFDTGAFTHHINVGADWHRQDLYKKYVIETRNLFAGEIWNAFGTGEELIEIADRIADPNQPLGVLRTEELRFLYDDYGFYIQDSLELSERWIASAGTRYSIISGDYNDIDDGTYTNLETYERFSSQFGLVYKSSDKHSFYGSYSEALRANYSLDDVGAIPADPELSDQIELGIKSLLFDGKFLSTFALYEINKTNIVDLTFLDGVRTSSVGHEQRVLGMDFDFTAQVSSNLNVIGALSLIEPEIVSGQNEGKKPALAAEQTSSLFAHYKTPWGFDINGGVKYVSERFGDDANQFPLKAYTTFDAGIAVPINFMSHESKLKISVKNLSNEKFNTAILGGVRINESEGRAILGTLKVEL